MLPKQISCILIFFDAFGYNSGSTKLTSNKKAVYFLYALHILMALLFSLYKVRLILQSYRGVVLIEVINYMLQYTAALCDYWLIIFDAILYRQEHRRFWTYFQHIDQSYSNQCHFNPMRYFLKFVSFFFASFLCIAAIILTNPLATDEAAYAYLPLIFICEFRIFYYIFYLELLHFQLKKIDENCLLKKKGIELHEMKWIRDYVHCVYEMTNLLNEIFGLSQLTGIMFCFYLFATKSNFMLIHFNEINYKQRLGEC